MHVLANRGRAGLAGSRIADFRAPGETTQGDYFMKDGIYNWLLRLTLEGDQPDLVFPANHQCDGPRQFCGTVTVLR